MATPAEPIQHLVEIPPPLPPRRRLKHSNTNPDIDGVKQKRSAWNIIDSVFNRNKRTEILTRYQQDPLPNKQTSFSSPDLTNIVATSTSSYNVIDIDDNDLEIMDIERSNSLNSAANQFLCRPPALNISANILWSHNLSASVNDASIVNLIGANVNSDHFLSEDASGYCKMASTSWKEGANRKFDTPIVDQYIHTPPTNRVIEDISGYCQMAPIINGSGSKDTLKRKPEAQSKSNAIAEDVVVQWQQPTADEDNSSLLDFSLISNDKHSSSRGSCHDENSSSGVSSDEGAIYAQTLRKESINRIKSTMKLDLDADDAISITCTESPTSPMAISPLEQSSTQITQKLDEKYPSYYPNHNIYSSPIDIKRPASLAPRTPKGAVRNLNMSCCSHNARRSSSTKTSSKGTPKKSQNKKLKPEDKERPGNDENSASYKDSPKAQKMKTKKAQMRGGGIVGGSNAIAHYPHAVAEKPTADTKNIGNKFKSKTKPIHETKKHAMSTTEAMGSSTLPMKTAKGAATKLNNFGTLPKTSPSSPKHIYRKCASLANRITSPTPPAKTTTSASSSPATGTVSTVTAHVSSATMPLSIHGQESKDPVNQHLPTIDGKCTESISPGGASKSGDITGGLLRFATLTRFRKIDFSPLKVKFTNILQRQNPEF